MRCVPFEVDFRDDIVRNETRFTPQLSQRWSLIAGKFASGGGKPKAVKSLVVLLVLIFVAAFYLETILMNKYSEMRIVR